jgi:pimeloyl-ACP methyl ester carboxylesterase
VGLSLGGHVAVYFAARYPEVVGTVFASGINMFAPSMWTPVLPYVLFCTQNLIQVVWRPLINCLLDIIIPRGGHDESTPCRLPLCRDVIAALVSDEEIAPATARTLVIAATKRGFLPTNDSVASTKRVGEIMKRGNSESKVVEASTMRHAWDLQDPQTFARCIEAWIEGKELAGVFTEL